MQRCFEPQVDFVLINTYLWRALHRRTNRELDQLTTNWLLNQTCNNFVPIFVVLSTNGRRGVSETQVVKLDQLMHVHK